MCVQAKLQAQLLVQLEPALRGLLCIMAGFASALLAVALALASITDGAITSVPLHRRDATLDHISTRSDRNVVCASLSATELSSC